jgi:hypothetical protein
LFSSSSGAAALDDRERSFDRIEAVLSDCHVGRRARDVDVEPEDADLGRRDQAWKRLRDDGCVRPEPRKHTLERAVPTTLLLHDGLKLHRRERGEPEPAKTEDGADDCYEPGFHVSASSAVEPIAVAGGPKRRRAPELLGRGSNHVDVAVQDERIAAGAGSGPVRDHVPLAGDVPRERGGQRMGPKCVCVHCDVDRLEPEKVAAIASSMISGPTPRSRASSAPR